jgi:hypothetical protein
MDRSSILIRMQKRRPSFHSVNNYILVLLDEKLQKCAYEFTASSYVQM